MNYLKNIFSTKKTLLVSLLFIPLLLVGCSDNPSSLGSDLLGQDGIVVSQLDSYTDTLAQTFVQHPIKLSLGSSNIIVVGKDANVESQILLAFGLSIAEKYLANYDSLNFVSASLTFIRTYSFGDGNQPFNVSVHQITHDWNSGYTLDSLAKLTYEPSSVLLSSSVTDSAYNLSLNTNLIKEWFLAAKDTTKAKNYGVLIKPNGICRFTGFAASTSYNNDVPVLKLILAKSTAYETFQDTLTYYGSVDVHVISGQFPEVSPLTTTIQCGTGVEGKLLFDLSKLPNDAVVNKAILTLTLDTLNTKTGSTFVDGLAAYEFVDSLKDTTDATAAASLTRTGNTYTGDIQRIINDMLYKKTNQGILITSPYLKNGLENYALYNSSALNGALKPRLVITYSQRKK